MAKINDDRTAAEKSTHRYLVVGTDRCLSGWGGATGGASFAAWACEGYNDAKKAEKWVRSRSDMTRVRIVVDSAQSPYRPGRSCAHLHVYVARPGHPALG